MLDCIAPDASTFSSILRVMFFMATQQCIPCGYQARLGFRQPREGRGGGAMELIVAREQSNKGFSSPVAAAAGSWFGSTPPGMRAMRRLILEDRRDLSLVDCLSFEIMQAHEIELVFGFDSHFEQAGFKRIS